MADEFGAEHFLNSGRQTIRGSDKILKRGWLAEGEGRCCHLVTGSDVIRWSSDKESSPSCRENPACLSCHYLWSHLCTSALKWCFRREEGVIGSKVTIITRAVQVVKEFLWRGSCGDARDTSVRKHTPLDDRRWWLIALEARTT